MPDLDDTERQIMDVKRATDHRVVQRVGELSSSMCYDFCDDWEHDLLLEAMFCNRIPNYPYPRGIRRRTATVRQRTSRGSRRV